MSKVLTSAGSGCDLGKVPVGTGATWEDLSKCTAVGNAMKEDSAHESESFDTCRDFCARHGLILTPNIWDGPEEQRINRFVHRKLVDPLKDELLLRKEAVVVNECFASLLKLGDFPQYIAQLDAPVRLREREHELLHQLRSDETLDIVLDALQPTEYFEKYSSIWNLICQNQLDLETITRALRTLEARLPDIYAACATDQRVVLQITNPLLVSQVVAADSHRDVDATEFKAP